MENNHSTIISVFEEVGRLSSFAGRFFQSALSRPFEGKELLQQCFAIGYKSLFLVLATGFIMGLVLTLQLRPTMINFGAVA
jgi:phospholipid/cholesterol/gamma-HCH transport system permease protein